MKSSGHLCVAVVLLTFAAAMIHLSAAETPGQLKADELVKTLLPAESQHTFTPIDPAWHAEITYQKLRPDAFVQIDEPSALEKKKLYRMVRYAAAAGQDAMNGMIKDCIYYPNGAIYREIDSSKDDVYCRRFFEDGSLRDYTHWQKWKWLAGLALDPVSKKPNFFSNGSGSLTTYTEQPGEFKVEWYEGGALFFTEQDKNSIRSEITLNVGNDRLQVTKEKEELLLNTQYEIWNRPAGSDPSFDLIYDPNGKPTTRNTDVHALQPTLDGRISIQAMLDQLHGEWKMVYPQRRKAFLDSFEKIVNASGQTWKSLGIEFIRDDAPWPKT